MPPLNRPISLTPPPPPPVQPFEIVPLGRFKHTESGRIHVVIRLVDGKVHYSKPPLKEGSVVKELSIAKFHEKFKPFVVTDSATAHDRPSRKQKEDPEIGMMVKPGPLDTVERLILPQAVKDEILTALGTILKYDELERVWGLSKITDRGRRMILNFYGPPGTGKTMTARAIAGKLDKPLLQVDYAGVVSKYLGDTAKCIRKIFKQATESGAIIFFDEADAMFSRRLSLDESCATSINQNRAALMQEMDRFTGIIVAATNLFGNYDPALLRRIARHVKFDLPASKERTELFRQYLPRTNTLGIQLKEVVEQSRGLSGGEITNVVLNAIEAASSDPDPAKWMLTTDLVLAEIVKVIKTKEYHSNDRVSVIQTPGGIATTVED